MTRLTSVLLTLAVGVILGFGILYLSEQKNSSGLGYRTGEQRPKPSARAGNETTPEPRLTPGPLKPQSGAQPGTSENTNTPGAAGSPAAAGNRSGSNPGAHIEVHPAPAGLAGKALIKGTVVAEENSTPLKVFTFGVKRPEDDWMRKDIQDAGGRFRWTLDPGKMDLFVSAPGYEKWRKSEMEIPAGNVTSITVCLRPKYRLEGHVLNTETGRPVAGAVLTRAGTPAGGAAWTARTGKGGWFTVRDPSRSGEPVEVEVTHDDYLPLRTKMTRKSPVKIRLRRNVSELTGQVLTARGKPIPDATIQVVKDDARQPETSRITSDAKGSFRVQDLTPGRFLVWVTAPRFPAVVRILDLVPGEANHTVFRLWSGLALKGRILRPDAQDPHPLTIQAFDTSGGFLIEAEISRDNRFTLENLAPGDYTLKVLDRVSAKHLRSYKIRVPYRGKLELRW